MLYVVIIILVTTGFRFIYRHRFIIFDYWGLNWQPLLNSHWFWRNCVCPTATPWNTAVLQLIFIDIWRNNLRLRLSLFFAARLSKKDIKLVMVPRLFLQITQSNFRNNFLIMILHCCVQWFRKLQWQFSQNMNELSLSFKVKGSIAGFAPFLVACRSLVPAGHRLAGRRPLRCVCLRLASE